MADTTTKGLLKKGMDFMGDVASAASHAHSAADLLGLIFKKDGSDSSDPNNGTKRATGLYGHWGFGDEREFQNILQKFMASYGHKANGDAKASGVKAHDTFIRFLTTHYQGSDRWSTYRAKRELDAFRLLVVKMNSLTNSIGEEKTTTTKTSNGVQNGVTTETKSVIDIAQKIFGQERPSSVAFLRRIVNLIDAASKEYLRLHESVLTNPRTTIEQRREIYDLAEADGHQAVVDMFRATGIPHMPQDGETDWINLVEDTVGNLPQARAWLRDAANTARAQQQNRRGLDRLFGKL